MPGPLSLMDPGFRPRGQQQTLAREVARALEDRASLVAEAGTGVGKTFAYLVPLLLSRRRAIVSTATKSLQDQLFLRDLPRLRDALRLPVRIALLKGRSSYLCLHRLKQSRQTATLDRFAVRALSRVEQWAAQTRSGDLAEIEGLDDRSPVIPLVTSTRDNCLGTDCPEYRDCHVVAARREAMAADLVVVNHHLFFADLTLRDSGVAELLPTVDAAVFDEAHQLMETGLQFAGTTLSAAQVVDLSRDLLAAGMAHARGLAAWRPGRRARAFGARTSPGLRRATRDLRGVIKLRWDERADQPAFTTAMQSLETAAKAAGTAVEGVEGSAPDFTRLAERVRTLGTLAARFAEPVPEQRVRWIDLGPRDSRLVESPLDIRDLFTQQRCDSGRAWIFHLGNPRYRRRPDLVQRCRRVGRCAQAARGQSFRLSEPCPHLGAAALPAPE